MRHTRTEVHDKTRKTLLALLSRRLALVVTVVYVPWCRCRKLHHQEGWAFVMGKS